MSFYAISVTPSAAVVTTDTRVELPDGAVAEIGKLRAVPHLNLVTTLVGTAEAMEVWHTCLSVADISDMPHWVRTTARQVRAVTGHDFQAVVVGFDAAPYGWFIGPQSDWEPVPLERGGLSVHPPLASWPPAVLDAGDAAAAGTPEALGTLHDAIAHAVVAEGLPIGGTLCRAEVSGEGITIRRVGRL
ncbi:hypothetical protein A6A04_12295 [Paramagnetospirillum marisnigri]|uniref:Uncharacterized protein n=1 Tax=Paramagnetospirillum marisnigri TaxID=1285242 RepID=A0A178MVB3_9PROT|nr:hypothetical protein [Paramagnetospirillum marisnigri]OAN54020.1 hypothetical protein A6A04_12295 [Paramagnetospirillum marisnigri]